MKYALIKIADNTKVRELEFGDEVPPVLQAKKGLRWLPIELIGENILVDLDTEIKEFSEIVTKTKVTKTWTVRPLTVGEIKIVTERKLAKTDEGMAQVIEDIGVAMITGNPLSQAAVDKINIRRHLRGEITVDYPEE